jgi:hypothetical protein
MGEGAMPEGMAAAAGIHPGTGAEGILTSQAEIQSAMQTGWANYYKSISTMSAGWVKGEALRLRDVWAATRDMLSATMQDYIRHYTMRRALEAGKGASGILGLGSFFSGLPWLAGGALAAGLIGGLFGSSDTPDMGGDVGLDSGREAGTRTLSRTVGIKTQSLVFNINVIHYSAAVYGRDGIRELYEDELRPAIQDDLDLGALGATI